MRLIACKLHNVRRHRTLELHFGRELTLIAGANESGKSTLVEALHKGLFLRATATGRGVEELRSRLHAGLPEVEIRFEAEAQTWQLRKRFAGASGTCQLSNGQGVALNGPEAEDQLAQLLGFDAPVEGRRITQLPERWAHLWVRQGEAGLNPFSGNQERYDHQRLVEQLQQQGSQSPLESALDRQVMEQIQDQVMALYTATGKVKAGSPLAEAQQRSQVAATALADASQHVADLEAAMEQWRSINERLETIERQQRPALQRELQLQQQIQLLQAQLDPLLQQDKDRQQLVAQQRQEQMEQKEVQQQLEAGLLQQQHDNSLRQQRQTQAKEAQGAAQELGQRQELLQRLLDLHQLNQEERQLSEHERQLSDLQAQAETLKQQLAALPEITADQVRQLRQAEQALAQATARCEAMAAGLEVLAADQPITLNGELLPCGERRRLEAAAELDVGTGVRIQITPGGGQALPQALEQQQLSRAQLQKLQQQLKPKRSSESGKDWNGNWPTCARPPKRFPGQGCSNGWRNSIPAASSWSKAWPTKSPSSSIWPRSWGCAPPVIWILRPCANSRMRCANKAASCAKAWSATSSSSKTWNNSNATVRAISSSCAAAAASWRDPCKSWASACNT